MSTQEPSSATTSFALRDPETFFRAQKRNRRATWRMSALGVFAAMIMGIPLTLALTPLLYVITLVVAEIVNHFSPLPPEFWRDVHTIARLGVRVGDYVFNHKGTLDLQELVWGAALFLLPGMLVAFALWAGVLALFRRGGVGGALLSLNAREPNQRDLKELQLADVVQEMAIAAGLPAPKLMLVDSAGANAAALGTSAKDARIVISRRLIDDLNRDQLQALLAHLIGSIGNGDLHVAFTVTSVFETCGLLVTLINSPFGKQSRGTLWRIVRYTFFRGGSDAAKAAEADAVCGLLAGDPGMDSSDIDQFFNSAQRAGVIRKFLRLVFFPIVFTNIAIEITLWFFNTVLVGPCMALVWRTRRYLADASAVELTRNPDALAGALERLSQDSTAIPGGAWATHLFVINPTGDTSVRDTMRNPQPSPEQISQAAAAWAASIPGGAGAAPSAPADYARLKQEVMATGFAAARGDVAAAARMQAFTQAMAAAYGEDASQIHIPNLADIAAARRGDRAAIARLRAARHKASPELQAKGGQTGLEAQSFLSFHPPLKKRLKRLERMGAHLQADVHRKMGLGGRLVVAALMLIFVPLLALVAGLMLVVIAMMIGLNLVFLTLWLAVIHAIFVWLNANSK
jgi:Zn-dependent protease with chaperone function